MDVQNKKLRNELNQHNYDYYVLDTSIISDFEFDLKLKELQELEKSTLNTLMKAPTNV
jgi:DNA ligase (NAD+)